MIDKLIGSSVSQITSQSKPETRSEPDSPDFLDALRQTFELAKNKIEKKELPGTEVAVYIPKPNTLESLNITDLTNKPLL